MSTDWPDCYWYIFAYAVHFTSTKGLVILLCETGHKCHWCYSLCHLTHDTSMRLSRSDLQHTHNTLHLHLGLNIPPNNSCHLYSKICTQQS